MKHPVQAVVKGPSGEPRFDENKIVQYLARKEGLNELFDDSHAWSKYDIDQFYQLMGYSISGYEELSMVSEDAKTEAREASDRFERKGVAVTGKYLVWFHDESPKSAMPIQAPDMEKAVWRYCAMGHHGGDELNVICAPSDYYDEPCAGWRTFTVEPEVDYDIFEEGLAYQEERVWQQDKI